MNSILNLYKSKDYGNKNDIELISQIVYWDKEPTHEQILFRMSEAGLSRYDVVTIEQGYTIDFNDFPGCEEVEHFPVNEEK